MGKSITVDPAILQTASQKIDGKAAEYEKLYRQLFSEIEAMGAAWQGVDNTAFVNQIKGFQDDFQKMVAVMKEYSEFLKSSADFYKRAQEDTVNCARKLVN